MAYGAPADPVSGTVITVAYAVANLLDPIRWLRLMTGNADPPGSSYVVVSTSTTTTSWQKVPADALAAGVAVANLGYVPANAAGQAFSGDISANNISGATLSVTGQVAAGLYAGGNLAAGDPSFKGVNVGTDGIIINGGPFSGVTGLFSSTVTAAGQFISQISNSVTPVFSIHANQAGVTVPNLKAATAALADVASVANAVAALSVTDAGIAAANKDGAALTYSMRTLGAGVAQAAAGNHTHTANARSASGSYVANGSAHAETLGWQPTMLLISSGTSLFAVIFASGAGLNYGIGGPGSAAISLLTGTTFVSTGWSTTNFVSNGTTYTWEAFG